MSIEIKYMGRWGNTIFQYTYARLLALKNNLYLKTKFPFQRLLKTTPHEPGDILKHPRIDFVDLDGLREKDFFNKELRPARYVLKGWFQDPDFYNNNRRLIRSFFDLKEEKKNTEDIIMAVRLGDYAELGWLIDPEWYLNILKKESFKKLYIVGADPEEPYLKHFRKYKPIVMPLSIERDFHAVRKFDKIICSNSTLIWWAAFLSKASRIYTFARWIDKDNEKRPILYKQSFLKNAIRVDGEFRVGYNSKTYYDHTIIAQGGYRKAITKRLKTAVKKPLISLGILPNE